MTEREAIHKLIQFRRILEKGVFPVGYRFDAEPFDMAVEALEKQIPKKAYIYNVCPECDRIMLLKFKFCPRCGQALKWEEQEDDCTKCKHALWDCEEYYNTQKKWWFVYGCRKDADPESCEEFEEVEDE